MIHLFCPTHASYKAQGSRPSYCLVCQALWDLMHGKPHSPFVVSENRNICVEVNNC